MFSCVFFGDFPKNQRVFFGDFPSLFLEGYDYVSSIGFFKFRSLLFFLTCLLLAWMVGLAL